MAIMRYMLIWQSLVISITFQAPTKTFNIAGIISSYAIVPNPKIREVLYTWLQVNELDKAHLALNDGEMFGTGGEGFMRLNVGCPRQMLAQALSQLGEAVKKQIIV